MLRSPSPTACFISASDQNGFMERFLPHRTRVLPSTSLVSAPTIAALMRGSDVIAKLALDEDGNTGSSAVRRDLAVE